MILELETDRLLLRQFHNDDFEPLAQMMSDEDHMRYIGGTSNRDTSWRRFASYIGHWPLRGYGFFALEEKASGKFLGWTGLWFPEGWPEREIGWTLLPSAVGNGFVTEAALRVRKHAYEDLGWKTAISLVTIGNEASRKVTERLGAKLESKVILWGKESGIYRHPGPDEI